jgi:hypothetical protein
MIARVTVVRKDRKLKSQLCSPQQKSKAEQLELHYYDSWKTLGYLSRNVIVITHTFGPRTE